MSMQQLSVHFEGNGEIDSCKAYLVLLVLMGCSVSAGDDAVAHACIHFAKIYHT